MAILWLISALVIMVLVIVMGERAANSVTVFTKDTHHLPEHYRGVWFFRGMLMIVVSGCIFWFIDMWLSAP